MTADVMLLTLPSWSPGQRVAVVPEPLTVECSTCARLRALIASHPDQAATIRHDDCVAGRVPFTGRVAIVVPCNTCGGRGCETFPSTAGRRGGAGGMTITHHDCEGCNGFGHLIVASADVTAVVPIVDEWPVMGTGPVLYVPQEPQKYGQPDRPHLWLDDNPRGDDSIGDKLAFVTPVPGQFMVLFDNVATVEEGIDGHDHKLCSGDHAPIPVAGGDTFRKWTP